MRRALLPLFALLGCHALFADTASRSIMNNKAAYIPAQCYVKQESGRNPCMGCHINSAPPNYIDDWRLQQNADFSDYTRINRYTDLFKDRTNAVGAISDDVIRDYARRSNYVDARGRIILAQTLEKVPPLWDVNANGRWDGYMPDCYFNFDAEGFDRDLEGGYTRWRAFAYYPFPGAFWPTNGSADDVLIRLPSEFSQIAPGRFDLQTYRINLAIVEAMIKGSNVAIEHVNEAKWGVDLDRDGRIAEADRITFRWQPAEGVYMRYVGQADTLYAQRPTQIAAGLYPEGTEFLHSVRYLDVDESGVKMAARFKELRYSRKYAYNSYGRLQNAAMAEIRERDAYPERLRRIEGGSEAGLKNGYGWLYQGFIEDADGDLRPQNYEESLYCIGCHSGIGATVDGSFAFARKFDHAARAGGWYHWLQTPKAFEGVAEPLLADGRYEYSLYLESSRAGDDFGDNGEAMGRFFTAGGQLNASEIAKLHGDISRLIIPSPKRAWQLDKAYRVIVREQRYIYGRDAHIGALEHVHREVDPAPEPEVKAIKTERYPFR